LRVSFSHKQRHAIWQQRINISFLLPFFILLTSVISVLIINTQQVAAATSSTLNFQGRLLTNTGGLVPDGSYNIEFKIYDDPTAGTNWWTENRTGGSAVTVKNGYFSVYLGEVTPFGTSIPWDQDLWMTMNVNADGEMTPRFKLTAVPYAFRAGAVTDSVGNAFTGDDLIQKSPSTIQAVNSALAAIRLNQAGAGGLLQLQGDNVDVFTVSKTGATTISGPVLAKNTTNSTSAFDVQNAAGDSFVKVDTTNSIATFGSGVGTASTILQGGSGGIQITSGANVNIGQSDTNGTLLVVDTKTDAGDPIGTNGAIYYNEDAQKFRCYENGAWIDCIGGAPYTGASVNYFSGAQNIGANQTAFPLENMVFTSATAVSNVAGVNGGFTAPADGSFRSCLVMNTANITAGTVTLRWRVNGVSVGSGACNMNNVAPTNRQASTILNPGVVTFQAGDILDVAIDTSVGYTPTTNDYSVYWAVEYLAGSGGAGSGGVTLQDVYDQSLVASVLTANNKNIEFNLANTAVDSDFVINVATGSTSRLVVQDNGTDTFSVNATGDVVAAGGVTVGNSSSATAGTIRWTGTDFEGFDGATWVSLTSGSGGGGSGVNFVSRVKQVNESVISSIALQDDDELTFPIGPNEEWSYRFVIQANANAAADLRFAVSAPGGAVCQMAFSDPEGSTSVGQYGCGVTTASIPGNTAVDLYEITGSVRNGGTAGNVTLRWAQFTSNATNTIVYAGSYVQAVRSIGAGGTGQPFAQDGNAFGETAILGTSDTQGLSIITDNTERIGIASTGEISIAGLTILSDDLVANRTTTGVTGTTTGTGSATTTLDLVADTFSVNDVVLIDNVGQDYYTRIVSDPGTGSYTVSPAITFENGRTVTSYDIQNIGATSTDYTDPANRFFQGYFLGGVVVGAGSTTISDGQIDSTTTLRIQTNGGNVEFGNGDVLIGGGLIINGSVSGDGSGLTNIDGSSVDGAAITAINASNISSGTLSDSLLSTNVALLTGSQTFSGAKTFSGGLTISGGDLNAGSANITTTGIITGATIVGNGSGLTNLDADNIASGTVADARLSTNVALLSGSQTFSGTKTFSNGLTISGGDVSAGSANITTTGQISGTTIIGNGSGLTNIEADDIATGTLADGRLSSNVTLLTGSQTFTGLKTFGNGLAISSGDISAGSANITTTGIITGATIVGNGSGLTNIDAGDIATGTLADGRLSTNVTLLTGSQTFSGLKTFGNGLTISAGNLAAGSANVTTTGQITGATILGDGSGLTNIEAGDIASGTLADARLSSNVALLTGSQTFTGTKTFSGGFVLGQSTFSSSATIARAVNVPDEAGTLCLSNTNTCGYLRLASGAAQTDASNNDVLSVNKTSATGNLISLQRNAGAVFTVANTGALQIQSTGTSALDIRNVGGTSYFSVDTNTGNVRIGSATADGVGVLFILDTKNTAGDPTGLEGSMYYNSVNGKNRCYEGGLWTDCMTMRLAGETTLGAASGTINVAINGTFEYLHCRIDVKGRSVNGGIYLRFNNNSVANAYGWNEYDIINAAVGDAQDNSDSEIQLTGTDTSNISASADLKITNFVDTQKIVDWSYSGASAIGTNNRRYSGTGNWNNTANSISSVQFITSTGTFNSGSHAWCEGRNVR
jgi:hypothetical protein